MKSLQLYAINSILTVALAYSLFTCITAVINYWALPLTILLFCILAYTNKWAQ